jgi:hypothetical protein
VSDLQQETVIDWLKAKHKELMDTGQWGLAATIDLVIDIIEGKIK